MRLNKFTVLGCIAASLLVLAGCASKAPPVKAEPEVVGQVPADPPKNPVMSADTLKAESKSIAVTDIYFKKESKNLTYVEETKTSSDSSSSSAVSPKTVEVSADKANASTLTGGPNSSAFPVKYTDLADQKPASSDALANTSSSANTQNTQTQKKSGYQSSVEYGELRYLANPIRGLLIKSGYKVVQAKPSVPTSNQGDEYFDIVKRIKAGDFGDANYVLYGVLTEISITDNVDAIPGTRSSAQQVALEVTVDFNMVDTQTNQIVTSFVASGDGKEVRIDGKDNSFKASMAKLMKLAANDLAEDVRKNLAAQNFVTNNPGSDGERRNLKRRLDDDASTLKVYK